MDTIKERPRVSFSINTHAGDFLFFEKMLIHKLRSLNYPFSEKLVFVDTQKPTGRYSKSSGSLNKLILLLDKLLKEKIIDRFELIPFDTKFHNEIFLKYFGKKDINYRAKNGSPIFQYLYAWERCKGDYIFHSDSDMFFNYDNKEGWIDEAIKTIKSNQKVIFAKCGSPPIADNFFKKIIDFLILRADKLEWSRSKSFTTRYFLMDKRRFEEKILPIRQSKKDESLKKSIFYTLCKKRFEKWNVSYPDYNWAIHPIIHGENFIKYLDDLIWAVENNIYPLYRKKYIWNIYTENRDINPWLKAIKESKEKRKNNIIKSR